MLSPCSALLLPAFFAYAFQSGRELTVRTGLFYLGLATIFVPLGMGASLATFLFLDHRDTMIIVAGGLLIAFGIAELAGRSFSFGSRGGQDAATSRSLFGTYTLGLVYGFGGFCSGPILGAVLTVAAASGSVFKGGGLLATYALGTTIPLFFLAMLWDRVGMGKRRWVRGWGVKFGPINIHSTQAIAGFVFIILGVSFILLQGTAGLSGYYEDLGFTELSFDADAWVKDVTSAVPDLAIFAGLAAILGSAAAWYLYRRRQADDDDDPGAPAIKDALPEHDGAGGSR